MLLAQMVMMDCTIKKANKMDEADVANAQVELNEQRSIKYAQLEAQKPIPKSKNCLWCGSKTKEGRRWCNRDCCNSWELYGRQ